MSDGSAPELPGFYFDKKKNRYFKLIPGQEHINPLTGKLLQKTQSSRERKVVKKKKCNFNNSKRSPTKNIQHCLSVRQIQSYQYPVSSCDQMLHILLKRIFFKKNMTKLKYYDISFKKMLISPNEDKILMQGDMQSLCLINSFDNSQYEYKSSWFHSFPTHQGSFINDVSFAAVSSNKDGFFAAVGNLKNGVNSVYLGPCITNQILSKNHSDSINTCKWHPKYLLYSLTSKIVVVYDQERHFTTNNHLCDGAHVVTGSSSVTALECNNFATYVGFLNSVILAFDNRTFKKAITFDIGDIGRNVCSLKALSTSPHLISRHGNVKDLLYLWDIRSTKKPILQYCGLPNKQNIGFRGEHKPFLLNSTENVLSCFHIDNIFRLWDVKDGSVISNTSLLEGGFFSDQMHLMNNKPGVLGFKNKNIIWIPI